MKLCPKCQTEKPITEFHKNRRRKDGLQFWCNECGKRSRPAERARLSASRYRKKHPQKVREYGRRTLLARYNITQDGFDSLLAKQGGRCAICRTDKAGGVRGQWHIDHDHKCCPLERPSRSCGKCVRGLLCNSCNIGIGKLKDDHWNLMAAAVYLARGVRR